MKLQIVIIAPNTVHSLFCWDSMYNVGAVSNIELQTIAPNFNFANLFSHTFTLADHVVDKQYTVNGPMRSARAHYLVTNETYTYALCSRIFRARGGSGVTTSVDKNCQRKNNC